MLYHIEINVSDLQQSKKFYSKLLPELGYAEYQSWPRGFSYKSGPTYLVFVQMEKNSLPEQGAECFNAVFNIPRKKSPSLSV